VTTEKKNKQTNDGNSSLGIWSERLASGSEDQGVSFNGRGYGRPENGIGC
jgi:hypothetical protein